MLFQLINRIEGKHILPVWDKVNIAAYSKSGWGCITFYSDHVSPQFTNDVVALLRRIIVVRRRRTIIVAGVSMVVKFYW